MKNFLPTFMLMLATGTLLVAAGCSDDDPVQVKDLPVTGPGTTDELMVQFKMVYQNMDVGNYLALLDPGYRMLLSAETIDAFPDVGPFLDLDEEERIHTRMFSGENLTDPGGHPVPGVESVSFNVMNRMTAWAPTDDEVNFPGSEWARFDVEILWYRGPQFSIFKVSGNVRIYVRAHETSAGGTSETYYLMAGMVDWTGSAKGVEDASWGSVKASFR